MSMGREEAVTYIRTDTIAVPRNNHNVTAIRHNDCDEIIPVGVRFEKVPIEDNPYGEQKYVDYVVVTRKAVRRIGT